MTTQPTLIRVFEQLTNQPVTVGPVSAIPLAANTRLGSFSKALTKRLPSAADAVQVVLGHWNGRTPRYDHLVLQDADGLWQVWQRRQESGRRKPTLTGGMRATRTAAGSGQWFILANAAVVTE